MNGLTRREFMRRAGVGTLGALGAGAAALGVGAGRALAAGKRPNFVFFLIDDMGWMDLTCFGSSFYETPNADRLAAEGMRFTDAYAACPVCSPTRASIMTGKYPARIGLTDYIAGRRRGKLIPATSLHYMPPKEVTLAEALKAAGYATFFAGKWHLGGKREHFPESQGFDVNIGGTGSGHPSSYFYPRWKRNVPLEGKDGDYLTDKLTDESLSFLDTVKDKPFLLYLSHYAVHTPLQSRKDLAEKYRAKAAASPARGPKFLPEGKRQARQVQDHAVYAGMVESVDHSVGRVMAKLEEIGVAENTIVIFMSDNGGLSTSEGSPTSNVPLRAGKGWLYEGGIREPMIVKWPGAVAPGSTCSEPVISNDFYPTMLEMAGLPLRPRQHVDGVSFVPLLRQNGGLDREAIYWHYPHYGNQGGSPGGAVHAGDWKLIELYEDMHVELYNLRDDIGEKNDLAAAEPRRAARLRKMLVDWRQQVGARMPMPNPDYGKPRKKRKGKQ